MILDKSFVQMLKPAEVDELSLYFTFVGTPTLVRESIADLKKREWPSASAGHGQSLSEKDSGR